MKYMVKNLRTNEIEVVYNELEQAECYIRLSVMFNNERKPLNIKRWTKRDFEIIKKNWGSRDVKIIDLQTGGEEI